MTAARSLAALLVVLALLGGLVLAGEWFARGQVEGAVTDVVARQLTQVSDGGEGFQDIDVAVRGSVLVGLVRGRFDGVTVSTGSGVVQGVPVRRLDLLAEGVATDGSAARTVSATVRAEAAGALESQLDDELGQAVLAGTTALPPDRLRVQAPFEMPLLGAVPVEVELLLRVSEGRLLVEPVQARAVGLDLDLTQTDTFRGFGVDDELPEGVDVTAVEVVDEDGTAVVVADLSCPGGCAFAG